MTTLAIIYLVLATVQLLTPGSMFKSFELNYESPKLYMSLAQLFIAITVMILIIL